MTNLISIVALLQIALSLLNNPAYVSNQDYRNQTDSLVRQTIVIANDTLSQIGKENTVNLNQSVPNVMGTVMVDSTPVIKSCSITRTDDSDENHTMSKISWSSENLSNSIGGILYGVIGHDGNEMKFAEFRNLHGNAGEIGKIYDSPVYKLIFDDGTTCLTK